MKKERLMEILNSKKQQLQNVLSAPVPTAPWLHQGYLRRHANAREFLAQLTQVIAIVQNLDDVQLVQLHTFQQFLRKSKSYKLEFNGSYCKLAIVQVSSYKTLKLLTLLPADVL